MGVVRTCKELVALIEQDGWCLARQTGSHSHYKHPVKQGLVTIPVHNKSLKKGTANSILKQAGLK
ncbi:MAG: type II toxin-antitoxin system HicA family toxin [Candidatus Fibromonas sp.]|jgi:predicted RNA binding protein YcfA (HicA-like mRNA interferase family)|nr:type II toxin-antitoxin system HicA family toxin [Candidatus Fibromonas sp.]